MLEPEESCLFGGISCRKRPVVGAKIISFFVHEVKTHGCKASRSVYSFSPTAVTDVYVPVKKTAVAILQMCGCRIIFGQLERGISLVTPYPPTCLAN